MQRAAATLQGAQSDNTMAQKEYEETKTQFEMDADSELETLRCRREPLLHTCSSSTHPAAYPAPPRVRLTSFGCTYRPACMCLGPSWNLPGCLWWAWCRGQDGWLPS